RQKLATTPVLLGTLVSSLMPGAQLASTRTAMMTAARGKAFFIGFLRRECYLLWPRHATRNRLPQSPQWSVPFSASPAHARPVARDLSDVVPRMPGILLEEKVHRHETERCMPP